jgi:hypothetical protein
VGSTNLSSCLGRRNSPFIPTTPVWKDFPTPSQEPPTHTHLKCANSLIMESNITTESNFILRKFYQCVSKDFALSQWTARVSWSRIGYIQQGFVARVECAICAEHTMLDIQQVFYYHAAAIDDDDSDDNNVKRNIPML